MMSQSETSMRSCFQNRIYKRKATHTTAITSSTTEPAIIPAGLLYFMIGRSVRLGTAFQKDGKSRSVSQKSGERGLGNLTFNVNS